LVNSEGVTFFFLMQPTPAELIAYNEAYTRQQQQIQLMIAQRNMMVGGLDVMRFLNPASGSAPAPVPVIASSSAPVPVPVEAPEVNPKRRSIYLIL
jgi:hypothetical protein